MKIIAKDRRQGKTTELLKIAQENQYAFVCINQREFHRIKAMQLDIPFLFTFQELKTQRHRGLRIDGIVVDDVDMCISNTIWAEKWGEPHTKTLIELSAKHWKYISVSELIPNLAHSIVSKADELGIDIPFPILHGERCHVKPTLFHDPEEYLLSIANRPVKYVTTNRIDSIDLMSLKHPTPHQISAARLSLF